MKEKTKKIYISLCIVICIIPFLGMFFFKAEQGETKQRLTSFPKIKKENKFNTNYLSDLGDYFTDHLAFRNELISIDSAIQGKLFKSSDVNSIIAGKNGWLFYSDSLNDYLGKDVLSNRAIFNCANNISLMQKYVEDNNKQFIFTITANKNSLYPENMPSYYKKITNKNNLAKLEKELKKNKINYVNLKETFENQDETLYFKQDSHWNNKGALLAYNNILKGIKHKNYKNIKPNIKKDYTGDLCEMFYPSIKKTEENYYYNYKKNYKYTNEVTSVEDALINTKSSKHNGKNLLMYRDSFGNSLLPFMANEFKSATFSKMVPYNLQFDMKNSKADVVIVEKVERNIDEFANAPLICALNGKFKGKIRHTYTATTVKKEISKENSSYIKISGVVDKDWIDKDSKIYVRLTNEENQKSHTFLAFLTSDDKSDYGYTIYLDKSKYSYENAFIEIIGNQKGFANILYEDGINLSEF